MDNRSRRSFLRGSALSLAGGICAAGVLTSTATAQERVCNPEQSDNFYATFYDDIIKTARGNESLSFTEIEELAGKMRADAASPSELKATMLKYFSLSAPAVAAVLQKVRQLENENERHSVSYEWEYRASLEPQVQATISQLNQQSLSETNLPFHLAILRRWVPPSERGGTGQNNVRVMPGSSPATTMASCPEEIYWRLIPLMTPWKMQACFHSDLRARKGSIVCDVNFGPFPTLLAGWTAFNPQAHALASLQGYGGLLLASLTSFSIKANTLGLVGWSPFSLPANLYGRKP